MACVNILGFGGPWDGSRWTMCFDGPTTMSQRDKFQESRTLGSIVFVWEWDVFQKFAF